MWQLSFAQNGGCLYREAVGHLSDKLLLRSHFSLFVSAQSPQTGFKAAQSCSLPAVVCSASQHVVRTQSPGSASGVRGQGPPAQRHTTTHRTTHRMTTHKDHETKTGRQQVQTQRNRLTPLSHDPAHWSPWGVKRILSWIETGFEYWHRREVSWRLLFKSFLYSSSFRGSFSALHCFTPSDFWHFSSSSCFVGQTQSWISLLLMSFCSPVAGLCWIGSFKPSDTTSPAQVIMLSVCLLEQSCVFRVQPPPLPHYSLSNWGRHAARCRCPERKRRASVTSHTWRMLWSQRRWLETAVLLCTTERLRSGAERMKWIASW